MKIWREHGSSHSGNVTIIGEFKTVAEAKSAFPLIDDFVRAAWEDRYDDLKAFQAHWEESEPNLRYIGPSEEEFEIGVDNEPDTDLSGSEVTITNLRSTNVGGIVKLLFMKDMKKITIEGHGA